MPFKGICSEIKTFALFIFFVVAHLSSFFYKMISVSLDKLKKYIFSDNELIVLKSLLPC